jgi:hypothetical protein
MKGSSFFRNTMWNFSWSRKGINTKIWFAEQKYIMGFPVIQISRWGSMGIELRGPSNNNKGSKCPARIYRNWTILDCTKADRNKQPRRHYFQNVMYSVVSHSCSLSIRGGPKNNRNLKVERELEVVTRCAARCRVSTQYSSSLLCGVSLGWVLLLLWLFF